MISGQLPSAEVKSCHSLKQQQNKKKSREEMFRLEKGTEKQKNKRNVCHKVTASETKRENFHKKHRRGGWGGWGEKAAAQHGGKAEMNGVREREGGGGLAPDGG